jgi:transporter family-2 protein
MTQLLFYVGAVAIGAAFAVYFPMLGQAGRITGSPALVSVIFFLSGAVVAAIVFFLTSKPSVVTKLADVPPWLLLSGVMSGIAVFGTASLIPRVGPGVFFVLLVAGQVTVGALLSHFGALGSTVDPITLRKLAGMLLVVGGAYLVAVR